VDASASRHPRARAGHRRKRALSHSYSTASRLGPTILKKRRSHFWTCHRPSSYHRTHRSDRASRPRGPHHPVGL